MDRLIAIGDIHGCYYTMVDLLNQISYNSITDTLIFLGDYIDRGRNSYDVVFQLKHLQEQLGDDKVICLRGNHEQMAIDYFKKGKQTWCFNNNLATLDSFYNNGDDIENYIDWFESLPHVYETPEIIFCHAGLSYPNLKDNTEADLLWGRDWIKEDCRPREKQVIFGHTPHHHGEDFGKAYMTKSGDICIDSGCVFGHGGRLCALIFNDDGTTKTEYADKAKKDY